jgi:hypothetical protein
MIRFLIRHAGWFLGVGVYLAIWILLPEVDAWRRAIGSIVLSFTIMISLAGWEYSDDRR